MRYDPMDFKHGAPCDIEDKALTESNDCWTVSGYAAVFGNKDLGKDVIASGAFAKA